MISDDQHWGLTSCMMQLLSEKRYLTIIMHLFLVADGVVDGPDLGDVVSSFIRAAVHLIQLGISFGRRR